MGKSFLEKEVLLLISEKFLESEKVFFPLIERPSKTKTETLKNPQGNSVPYFNRPMNELSHLSLFMSLLFRYYYKVIPRRVFVYIPIPFDSIIRRKLISIPCSLCKRYTNISDTEAMTLVHESSVLYEIVVLGNWPSQRGHSGNPLTPVLVGRYR